MPPGRSAQDRSLRKPNGELNGSIPSPPQIPTSSKLGRLDDPSDSISKTKETLPPNLGGDQSLYQLAYTHFRGTKPKDGIDLIATGALISGSPLDQKLADLAEEYDYDRMHVKNIRIQDLALKEIRAMQGFDGLPVVCPSLEDFEALSSPIIEAGPFTGQKLFGEAKGGYDYVAGNSNALSQITELSRGFQSGIDSDWNPVTPKDAIREFLSGDHWAGLGEVGSGTYAAVKFPDAAHYTDDESMEHVVSFKLTPGARVGSYRDLQNQIVAMEDSKKLPKSLINMGRYAAAKGYDAYVVEDIDTFTGERSEISIVVVLNRSKIVLAPIRTEDIFSYRWDKAHT